MANVLNTDKQIAVIAALAESSSIRSIERMTGIHRDTIMRLGVRTGQGCTALMDKKMRDLPCLRLEMDEIWGFVGKKDRNLRAGDDGVGSVWEGVVEEFGLIEHETAEKLYAWTHLTDDPSNPKRHVTVLHLGPVDSPLAAVRAAIVQEFRDAETT